MFFIVRNTIGEKYTFEIKIYREKCSASMVLSQLENKGIVDGKKKMFTWEKGINILYYYHKENVPFRT